ncbi:MAG: glycosyltransferase, partial [Acidobacteria bacterium]|nr:glycosyltransferase [Acidobacteriota bacterium]
PQTWEQHAPRKVPSADDSEPDPLTCALGTRLAFYRASDVGLVTLRRLPIFTKVLPSKLFELMGAGCPIICSVEGEAAQLVERAGAGICIEPENPEALREAILRLRARPAERQTMGRSGEVFARTNYSRDALAKRYLEALCEHISPSSSSPR